MFKFLKVIFLLIVLAAFAASVFFQLNYTKIHEELKTRLAAKISTLSDYSVSVGSIKYVPLQAVTVGNVRIYEKDEKDKLVARITDMTVTIDIPLLIRDKQLKTIIELSGLYTDHSLSDATVRTLSRAGTTFKEALDPAHVYSVSVIEGRVAARNVRLNDVFGVLDVDNMTIPSGKLHFTYNEDAYLLGFSRLAVNKYDLSLRSEDLNLSIDIAKTETALEISSLSGIYQVFYFDLKGEVSGIYSSEPALSMSGTVETDLTSFAQLPGEAGKLARDHTVSGKLSSSLFFNCTGLSLEKCSATATTAAENIRIDNILIPEITGKFSLDKGILTAPLINGTIYRGTLLCTLEVDFLKKNSPYTLRTVINNMDLGSFVRAVTDDKEQLFGTLNADLSLSGSSLYPETALGHGSVTVSDANLGTMPIATPLLGDWFSNVQNAFNWDTRENIEQAFMDFEIKDRHITTDDLTFLSDDMYITSEGYVDFDGNLDFNFQSFIRDTDPQEDEDWQTAIRNTVINLGKFVSKSRLSGTVKDPVWGI
ncbi:MAG: AsmA-like C-terminal region-containing protein [Candidatus Tantalella remota]|nr:AsmA-like C-terminal region-containing protein [Candidatus Tantalella remota]